MTNILFFIPNLMHGGAEKVLVNLVNNMDSTKFKITIQTIFDVGVNKQYLKSHIAYKYVFKKLFRGNTTLFKLFSPEFLYKIMIKDKYDIIVSYLEGSASRILAGCNDINTKKVAWIHTELQNAKKASIGFRNIKEANKYYNKYDKIISVSKTVEEYFKTSLNINVPVEVIHNTIETEKVFEVSKEPVDDITFDKNIISICSVGKIQKVKGFDRLAKVHKMLLSEGIQHRILILGVGEEKNSIERYVNDNGLSETFLFLGYKNNPYKYVSKCDLYVCSSFREGFSTAVTEALIVGTPVLTTLCSGMEEILGENSEHGIIVENNEIALYEGLKKVLLDRELLSKYKRKAELRGKIFSKEKTVKAVEEMLGNYYTKKNEKITK